MVTSRLVRSVNQFRLYGIFECPVEQCRGLFLAIYRLTRPQQNVIHGYLEGTLLAVFTQPEIFSENIQKISPSFCQIFEQARVAEANNLDQICGPGYRKALEFLIKDFLIAHKYKDDATVHEKIKSAFLGKVIDEFVEEERIIKFAKRAVWIGNDETHYVRKWETKDVSDLKSLIRITVNFVDLAIEADAHLADMPEP